MQFLFRHAALTTLLATIVVGGISILGSAAAFHLSGVDPFPLAALALAIVMPVILVPAVLYPLFATIRRQGTMSTELGRQARTDALTDLPNRRAFFEFARGLIDRQPTGGTLLAAMTIDVDNFKRVNDSYGHDHGDIVLKRVAGVIRTEVEAANASHCIVARLGGEEFVVIADGLAATAVGRLADRICGQVHHYVGAGDRLEPVTVSIGIAFRRPGMKIDQLLRASDDAVYAAKRAGRDQWAFADDETAASADRAGRHPPPRNHRAAS